jgi:hypothetical protein
MAGRAWSREMRQLLDRAVALGERSGVITIAELNAILPEEDYSASMIEDVYSFLNDQGINIVEDDAP